MGADGPRIRAGDGRAGVAILGKAREDRGAGAVIRALALCLLLTACAAPTGLRDPAAPVSSQVGVAAAEVAGFWFVRQGFPGLWPAPRQNVAFRAEGSALILDGTDPDAAVRYAAAGPGRWQRRGPERAGAPATIWVFWADADRRTLVLGDPEGRYGVILDRAASGGPDRMAAARDILDWYGFPVAGLSGS